ncbi:MAG: hypothetical protein OSB70_07570 [Myxococcota bacterium]|nr:hypothetical protein [Myxococcota bacterium]
MSGKSNSKGAGEGLYEVDGAVALITLNRPRYHNARGGRHGLERL